MTWAVVAGGIPAAPATAQSVGGGAPVAGRVERIALPGGPELWVARVPDPGPAGISLVFPGGGAAGVQELAHRVAEGCPGAPPVLAAGPDYETLSLSRSPEEVPEALECLGRRLDGAGGGMPASRPGSAPDSAALEAFSITAAATRSAAGILLSTLYAPAPVPGGALDSPGEGPVVPLPSHLVVAGAVDSRAVARRAEAGIGPGGAAARGMSRGGEGRGEGPAPPAPRPPVTTEVLVLDRPGESLADVRVGGLVVPGDHPDWPALVAVREILADRLAGGPWAFAEFLRVRGPGAFVAGGRMPVDALPGALDRLWTELRTLGDHLVAPEDLRAATAPLAESFRTATAGAPALAEELARAAALGLGPEAVAGYTARLGTLTPDAVRRAAREHLDPARLVIAAEGDGAFLAAELGRFGPVRRIGAPLPPPDWPPLTVDGGRLSPGVLRYRVRIGDREVGSARREILPVDGGRIRVRSTARIGEEEVGQEVHATLPELAFLEGTTIRDGRATASLRREGGRLVGTTPGGTPVELSIPRGTVVSDLLEPTLWASALRVGANHRVPVFGANGTAVTWAGVQVLGEEEVTVPAGTFETLRVRVTGPELLTLWLRRDPPHRTVRLLGANGVILELVGEDRGGG